MKRLLFSIFLMTLSPCLVTADSSAELIIAEDVEMADDVLNTEMEEPEVVGPEVLETETLETEDEFVETETEVPDVIETSEDEIETEEETDIQEVEEADAVTVDDIQPDTIRMASTDSGAESVLEETGNISWEIREDSLLTLVLSGSGDLDTLPEITRKAEIRKVIINKGFTSIGSGAFAGYVLTEVEIPDSVATINPFAFDTDSVDKIIGNFDKESERYAVANGIEFEAYDPYPINLCTISGVENKTYTGSPIKQKIVYKHGNRTLVEGKDFEVIYTNNTNTGTARIDINGIGNYCRFDSKTFTIAKYQIPKCSISGVKQAAYNGKEIKQNLVIKHGDKKLVEGKDYKAVYSNNINAGTAKIRITGLGNYGGSTNVEFKIWNIGLKDVTIKPISNTRTYTGWQYKPNPWITFKGMHLIKDKDYTLKWKNNIKAGTATVEIKGINNYGGSRKVTFNIKKADIKKVSIKDISNTRTYSGKPFKPSPYITYKGKVLVINKDYKLSWKNNVNAGKATVYVYGLGNFKGTTTKPFNIKKASIAKASVTGIVNPLYNGKARKQNPKVVLGKKTLVDKKHYVVSYANNVNAGIATMTVKGIGNYSGAVKKKFKIRQLKMWDANVYGLVDKNYNGKAHTQNPTVKMGTTFLRLGTDYTITYANNINAGNASIIFEGHGNYTGKLKKTFKIHHKSIASASVSKTSPREYTGDAQTQTLTVSLEGKTLVPGRDYKLTYKANVNAGTAHVYVNGINNYSGTLDRTFTITKAPITGATISGLQNKYYKGEARTQSEVLTYKGKTLKNGRDYTVTYQNNVNVGTATMIVNGTGNFTGTFKRTFNIVAMPVSNVSVRTISYRTYTGSAITPTPSIKYNGKYLHIGTDYTLSYNNNVNIGNATVIITGKGNFTGTKSVGFLILPAQARLSSLSSGQNYINVYWNGGQASGYRVQYSTNGNFNNAEILMYSAGQTSGVIQNLSAGTTYYVRVQAYAFVNGTRYYSKWSPYRWISTTAPAQTTQTTQTQTGAVPGVTGHN